MTSQQPERPDERLVPGEACFSRLVDGSIWCNRIDPVILCSPSILNEGDPRYVSRDDNIVTFTASNGWWRYQIIGWDWHARAYILRQVAIGPVDAQPHVYWPQV